MEPPRPLRDPDPRALRADFAGVEAWIFDLDNTLWDHRKNAYLTLKEIYTREKVQEKYQLGFEEFHKEYFTINENLWAQIRDGKIDKQYIRDHRFYDSFLFFGIDDLALSQKFENNFSAKF